MPQHGGVVERPPEHFAVLHVHQQAVAVVGLGPIVVEFALGVFAEPKHAGERGDADGGDGFALGVHGRHGIGFAEIQDALDVGNRGFTWLDEEFVRADAAHAVEDRIESELRVFLLWLAEPPIGEDRKFLGPIWLAGING